MSLEPCQCGAGYEVFRWHYPTRKAPHNEPFVASMYFRDPFFHAGKPLKNYCGPRCYLEDNPR